MNEDVHYGLTFDEYRAIDAINHSVLRLFERSPAHAKAEMDNPPEQTKAQLLGRAVHSAVLEPKTFGSLYAVGPGGDRRTKAVKAAWAEFLEANQGKTVLTGDEFSTCTRVSAAVWANPIANRLLSGTGSNEVTLIWKSSGVACKARLDRATRVIDKVVVGDIKTTDDASPAAFARSAAKYRYHTQAAWYLDGIQWITGEHARFLLVAVEKVEPFGVAVYELDQLSLEQGRHDCARWLQSYKTCKALDSWPCYAEAITELRLPGWAVRPDEWESQPTEVTG